MTKEKIIKLLEENKIFENLKTIEEINEYKEIFNRINNVLDEKIKAIELKKLIEDVWNFSEKICSYLKNNNINNYNILSKEEFEKRFCNNEYLKHITLPVSDNVNIVVESNYLEDYTCFGIVASNDKKVSIKELDKEIKEKFPKLIYYEEHNDWVYLGDINIYIDNPEEIAEAMIQLHNLLKKHS